jgi:hypothetical protein
MSVDIHIEKPYQERCGFYGMVGSGKSNLFAYMLQRTASKYILIDVEGVHSWQPLKPDRQTIIRPSKGTDLQGLLMSVIRRVQQEKYFIVAIEGIDAFQTCYWMPEELRLFCQYGRNYRWGRSSYWVTFRRAADVHKDILGNVDHHFIFRTFEPNDVNNYYRRYLGKEVAQRLQSLPDYHFYYWKPPNTAMLCRPVRKTI